LPLEVNLQACRVVGQDALSATKEYTEWMMDQIDKIPQGRFRALREIEKEKIRVMRVYNKRVMEKSFQVAELVWETILPIGSWSGRFGKWSPSWDEPYVVSKIVPGCDRTTSEMRDLSPKIISGDSRRSENAQTHTHKHTVSNIKFKLKLLHIKCHILGFTKDIAQNVL
jgi:hypothetical protein